ncbi:MAG TPA: T9SS type A sorting domain-containing protein [Saprospiraceae bacterium]|nr:T9SS type A sorting domain-containing protein [Saprospiraceae bacterium]
MKVTMIICAMLCCMLSKDIQAQGNTINRTFSFLPFKTSIFNSIVVTDSCYYITGIVADSVWPYNAGALFVKTDLDGNPLIIKGLTDSVNRYETWFQSLRLDRDGNLVTHGYNYAQDTNTLFFVKYDSEGNVLTLSDFHAAPDSIQEIPYDMVSYGNDQSMVCVEVAHEGGYSELWVVKLDKDGNPQFSKPAASNVNVITLNRITTSTDGGFIIGGLGSDQNVKAKNIIMQVVLTKIDSLGNKEWDYLSPVNEDWFGTLGGVVVNENQEIVFGTAKGKAIPINSSSEYFVWDWCIVKMDANKNILWRTFFRPSADAIQDGDQHLWNMIALRNQNGYVSVGQNLTFGPFWHGWIAKVAENGDSLWMRSYNFEGMNIVYELKDIKEDLEGNLIMVGEYRDITAGDVGQKAWLLKVDQYGCLIPGCQLVHTEDVDSEEINLILYPNPANDFLSFYCSFSPVLKELSYSISDIQGQVVFRSNHLTNNTTNIYSVGNLAQGTYFLQLISSNQIIKTEKFIVAH